MSGRLAGKVALVIGGGSVGPGWGNGKACAVKYAREGAQLAVVDINPAAAQETVQIIHGEAGIAHAYACDVSDESQVLELIPRVLAQYSRIDILYNNVGAPIMGSVADMSTADWDRAQDLNLKGSFMTCRGVLPHMKSNRGGVITNISSIAAIRHTGYPYAAYYASKAALNNLTMSIALEYARFGIRANTILPGMMDTPHIYQSIAGQYQDDKRAMVAQRSALCPMGRMGTAWDIANAAVFLASDEAGYITGVNLPVDGGITCRI